MTGPRLNGHCENLIISIKFSLLAMVTRLSAGRQCRSVYEPGRPIQLPSPHTRGLVTLHNSMPRQAGGFFVK